MSSLPRVLIFTKTLFTRSVLLVCLLSLGEGPWAGLQFVAWSKMIWERSSEMGWLEAVADVASGNRPCEICRLVESRQDRDEENLACLQGDQRQPLALAPQLRVRPALMVGLPRYFFPFCQEQRRFDRPPHPPPQFV